MSGGDYTAPAGSITDGGSGGNGGTGGSGKDLNSICTSLSGKSVLRSPDPKVLSKVNQGDVFSLVVEEVSNRKILLAKTEDDESVGSITSANVINLINCIEAGYSFVAIVDALDGGNCSVDIRVGAE